MTPKNFLPKEEYWKTLDRKHCGSGALIRNRRGEILLEKPSYKDYWIIPGGGVNSFESPKEAVEREIFEELGIAVPVGNLIGLRYVRASDSFPEALSFVFDGGVVSEELSQQVKIDGEEVLDFKFISLGELDKFVSSPHRAMMLRSIVEAAERGGFVYLEDEKTI